VMFLETDTDLAVYHVLVIGAFKDGSCSLEKALEAKERWPQRYFFYAGIDPMADGALDELDRQMELLNPIGLKLYPNTWVGNEVKGWHMDNPEVAFPIFERAQQLGLPVVAIHKAVPVGHVPMEYYRMEDIDRAAIAFPNINFEVVHGGMAFIEDTAWQMARFDNVYINLEITTSLAAKSPGLFERTMAELVRHGGPHSLERICWGTGCVAYHPRPHLEAFTQNFQFSPETIDNYGVPELTRKDKENILAGNYARMTGIDLDARLNGITGDEFAVAREKNGQLLPPWSTTKAAAYVE
jgi:uncharacterized protein